MFPFIVFGLVQGIIIVRCSRTMLTDGCRTTLQIENAQAMNDVRLRYKSRLQVARAMVSMAVASAPSSVAILAQVFH